MVRVAGMATFPPWTAIAFTATILRAGTKNTLGSARREVHMPRVHLGASYHRGGRQHRANVRGWLHFAGRRANVEKNRERKSPRQRNSQAGKMSPRDLPRESFSTAAIVPRSDRSLPNRHRQCYR